MAKTALNIHLFREDITRLQVLKPSYQDGRLDRLHPDQDLPFPAELHVLRPRPKETRWSSFVRSAFTVSPELLINQSSSALLVMEAAGRVWAISFGYGSNAIERTLLEPDFGLRVALNAISEDKVRKVDARTNEQNVLQRSTRASQDGPLTALRMDLNQDWVRAVKGSVSEGILDGPLEGGDTVKLSWAGRLSQLEQLCAHLLELFQRDHYKAKFPFLDAMRPVKPGTPTHKALERALHDRLSPRIDATKLGLAFPTPPHSETAFVRFAKGRTHLDFDDLNLQGLGNLMDKAGCRDPAQIRVIPLDANRDQIGPREKLHSFLVAEVEHDGGTYLLNAGQWFRLDKDFVAEVERDIAQIVELSGPLDLPVWRSSEDEGAYNQRVARVKGWVPMDKKLFHMPGRQKVEVCDVLAPPLSAPPSGLAAGPLLLHVKKMTASASLSHLFAQGVVSAEMMNAHELFHGRLKRSYKRLGDFDAGKPTVVYVIGTDKAGPLSRSMFFFAKVALRHHARQLARRGVQVAIARVECQGAVTARSPRAA